MIYQGGKYNSIEVLVHPETVKILNHFILNDANSFRLLVKVLWHGLF